MRRWIKSPAADRYALQKAEWKREIPSGISEHVSQPSFSSSFSSSPLPLPVSSSFSLHNNLILLKEIDSAPLNPSIHLDGCTHPWRTFFWRVLVQRWRRNKGSCQLDRYQKVEQEKERARSHSPVSFHVCILNISSVLFFLHQGPPNDHLRPSGSSATGRPFGSFWLLLSIYFLSLSLSLPPALSVSLSTSAIETFPRDLLALSFLTDARAQQIQFWNAAAFRSSSAVTTTTTRRPQLSPSLLLRGPT